ncbi:hypothetical protein BJ878DRAFT_240448 [Calycina marina]|uniref:Myb-like domain-containing protein n=1 Tax=Calycina marina TaxID=1763456 RepID=A0A9P7YXL9_9HELO|nr:hypothetical protein BJ878DRAFT_240448 [Calycina marina]
MMLSSICTRVQCSRCIELIFGTSPLSRDDTNGSVLAIADKYWNVLRDTQFPGVTKSELWQPLSRSTKMPTPQRDKCFLQLSQQQRNAMEVQATKQDATSSQASVPLHGASDPTPDKVDKVEVEDACSQRGTAVLDSKNHQSQNEAQAVRHHVTNDLCLEPQHEQIGSRPEVIQQKQNRTTVVHTINHWSGEEEAILLKLCTDYKKKNAARRASGDYNIDLVEIWDRIAAALPGRKPEACKNKWHQLSGGSKWITGEPPKLRRWLEDEVIAFIALVNIEKAKLSPSQGMDYPFWCSMQRKHTSRGYLNRKPDTLSQKWKTIQADVPRAAKDEGRQDVHGNSSDNGRGTAHQSNSGRPMALNDRRGMAHKSKSGRPMALNDGSLESNDNMDDDGRGITHQSNSGRPMALNDGSLDSNDDMDVDHLDGDHMDGSLPADTSEASLTHGRFKNWTREEDDILMKICTNHQKKMQLGALAHRSINWAKMNWPVVGAALPGRSLGSCHRRWQNSLSVREKMENPESVRRRVMHTDEFTALAKLVDAKRAKLPQGTEMDDKFWQSIAKMHISDGYSNHRPWVLKSHWEMRMLDEGHERQGNDKGMDEDDDDMIDEEVNAGYSAFREIVSLQSHIMTKRPRDHSVAVGEADQESPECNKNLKRLRTTQPILAESVSISGSNTGCVSDNPNAANKALDILTFVQAKVLKYETVVQDLINQVEIQEAENAELESRLRRAKFDRDEKKRRLEDAKTGLERWNAVADFEMIEMVA